MQQFLSYNWYDKILVGFSGGKDSIAMVLNLIDSGVDTEWVRQRRLEAFGSNALDNPDLLMPPSSVAESYWQLYQQPRSAWTFELENRPFGEKW